MKERIKQLIQSDRAFFVVIVILVGIASFGLGRQSVFDTVNSPTQTAGILFVEAPPESIDDEEQPVVASRNGTKYHRLDCPGAETIKEANLIRFASVELAKGAGYLPAANCDF